MLDDAARIERYQAQNGFGTRLTPRQRRRASKKRNAQKPQAVAAREARSAQRAKVRESRKQRLAGLLGR